MREMAQTDGGKWSWWVGHDEERFHTECDSREEAVRIAREECEGGWIVEAQKPKNIPLSGYFDADSFLERAEDSAFDDHGDPEGDAVVFDAASKDVADLQEMVRATIDQWQQKHGLIFTGFAFTEMRNLEFIPGPEPVPAEIRAHEMNAELPAAQAEVLKLKGMI